MTDNNLNDNILTSENYDDIINLPHHVSKNHKPMPLINRAAQFAPFAALTGYDAAIYEAARLTENRIELTDYLNNQLNDKMNAILQNIDNKPLVKIVYFKPDEFKSGGKYVKIVGNLKFINEENHTVVLVDGMEIKISEIVDIDQVE